MAQPFNGTPTMFKRSNLAKRRSTRGSRLARGLVRSFVAVALWMLGTAAGTGSAAAPDIDYARDVKPILQKRCWACHGALAQKSGLRLDTGAAIRNGGESGAAVVPGKKHESLLLARVAHQDAEQRMPPEGEPLSAAQIETLARWIELGAKSPSDETPERDPRDHWAFQIPRRAPLPASRFGSTNPIDTFVDEQLAARQLVPRPAADPQVLARRVHLDLTGLPPTRDELLVFLADASPDAYERLVDRLLNSPRYGERWARHWMDVWRYADWHGRRHVPDVWNSAPQIWRWRDWIVRSLNEDKGYDQMLREMLAADELHPDDPQSVVATGYLIRNWYALNPNDWMRSTVEHTGKAFLGLTFNCAHCHDHKYDPIAQDDYFRLRAFFEPIYIRQDRVPGEPDPGPFQDYDYAKTRKIQRLGLVRIFDKAADAPTWFYTGGDERNRVKERGSIAPGVPAFLAGAERPKIEPITLPPSVWNPGANDWLRAATLRDANTAVTNAQLLLAETYESGADDPSGASGLAAGHALSRATAKLVAAETELASVAARLAAADAKYATPPQDNATRLAREANQLERLAAWKKLEADVLSHELALAIAESKPAADPMRMKQVDAARKQLMAARAALDKARAAAMESTTAETYTPLSPVYPRTSTGRRRALAEWITSSRNPLTARVAVNHIWLRHFHAPLVASVNDFGRNGSLPSHPELLDWLAVDLMESGWSMKRLHRWIVTSAAYRRSSATGSASDNAALDPENKWLWRMNVGRMESETLRDSLLWAARDLDGRLGGQELENTESLTTHRRSLYYSVFPEQGGQSPLGELFDGPDPRECYRRTRSVIPQQALALTNAEVIHRTAAAIVQRWNAEPRESSSSDEKKSRDERFVIAMFQQLLSRSPTSAELAVCTESLLAGAETYQDVSRAQESLVRVLLNHNDFVTIR